MPFSPLIGISFVFHLVLALLDLWLSTRRDRKASVRKPEACAKRQQVSDFPSFVPGTRTFTFERITE